jgi:hypothetical protein
MVVDMFEFLKTESFSMIFSFVVGLGCMALLKPMCAGADCRIQKAPPYEEVKKSTYQLGQDCFQFQAEPIACPSKGVIEPFQRFIR